MQKIKEIMRRTVWTCRRDDSCTIAARLMWEHDIGALPVVDHDGKVVGMVTDRDECMAAYTTGRALPDLPVELAMADQVVSCTPDDTDEAVARLMAKAQIHRVPVVDADRRPVGIVTLNDLSHVGAPAQTVATTLAAVSQPRA